MKLHFVTPGYQLVECTPFRMYNATEEFVLFSFGSTEIWGWGWGGVMT